ncbi:sugar phosphate isomerase/epimerase [Natranaerovirga hydrolytica]|uniref:Sugar phosphate isomerase/epimerase n=1 Tax=Natranaerovirga hydrolytica TaxID=680378 RepID=A0A4R1MZH4_9FIRM|nr:sugar phosphate isomerase/epimerase family protein [Natranaerovirga hydrolytica]TCK98585.1 sugar phosphate isomerase/epimerase [Natranaerovirga hydrolytica]
MNRIGVRGHDFGKMNVDVLPKYIKELGFEAVQLAPVKAIKDINSFEDITEGVLEKSKEEFLKNDVEISVYGCYVEIGMLDKAKRLEQVDKFIKGISHTKRIGANLVGTETTGFPLNGDNREAAYQGLKDSVLRMVEEAEKQNVCIGIEPVARHTLNSPELTKRLLDEVNSDKLKVIIDAVNLFTVENIHDQQKIITNCFEFFGDKIEVLHLKDITLIGDRNRDEMKIVNDTFKWECIGNGIVDYKHIFSFVKNKNVSLLREGATIESYKTDLNNTRSVLNTIQ